MSLSTQILLSLGLGIATGLFFGEWMAPLAVVGDVFVRLLQMTVLPYVVVSLMGGLGRLGLEDAKRLGAWFLGLLFVLWVIAFAMVALMPLSFPTLSSASFFSTTLVEPAPNVDFVGLYVPTNPFHSMANSVVPAVVLFSIALGVALIGIPDKRSLLQTLDSVSDALLRVSQFVVHLTPVGVFSIAASAAGTMSVAEFARVQVYLVSYIALSALATFWVLPGLVSALTPLRARQVIGISKDALVTAFATGSSFVVIPMLAASSKELLERIAPSDERVDSLVDVIIPASHNFPHTAKVLTLSFVLFAGWFDDSPVPISEYPFLFVSGVASTFGSVNIAIPFLLDLMQLPHDLFQLFVATSVLNARFGTLLQAMHMLALTLLGACALVGVLRPRPRALIVYLVTTVLLVGATVGGARALFAVTVDTTFSKGDVLAQMEPLLAQAPMTHYEERPSIAPLDADKSRFEQILERGSMRVCYRAGREIPFAYLNGHGDPVGFDIEMQHALARGLGLSIELIAMDSGFSLERDALSLSSGLCDVLTGRGAISMDGLSVLTYSEPYMNLNFGFVVEDHRRREFNDLDRLRDNVNLRIAFPDSHYYLNRFRVHLPEIQLVPVQSVQEFFDDGGKRFDAMIYPAEIGSAWTLLYPDYGIVVPRGGTEQLPLAYTLPFGEDEWKNAFDTFLDLKRTDGTIDRLYDHWILGRTPTSVEPRWSIIRDVLGWVD